jgi:sterol 3beta-glucosyltransferase
VLSAHFYSKVHSQSVVNVTMKPAAGVVGLVAHPAQGAWKSMQKLWAQEQEQYQRKIRVSDGVRDVNSSTRLDREAILEKFKAAKLTTKDRQTSYKNMAEKEMYGDQSQDQTETDMDASHASTSTASMGTIAQTPLPKQGEDAAFQRDLELATQISLAEQRGYERGLAGAANR